MSFTGLSDADLRSRKAEWTAAEILQQPDAWRRLGADIERERGRIDAFLAPLLAQPDLRVVLAGAGTSSFAGQILAPYLSERSGRRFEAIATTDIVACPRDAFPRDEPTLLVSFARSGSSPESVATTEIAGRMLPRCHHLVITCNPDGELFAKHSGREGSLVLLMPEGTNDRAFAMTSSFTSMMLATLLAFDGGGTARAARLARAGEAAIGANAASVRSLAAKGFERIVYLGSGRLRPLAQESALKVLELTAGRALSLYDTPLGFRHGPKSVLDDRTLVVVYLSNDPGTRRYDLDLHAELARTKAIGGLVAVTAGQEVPGGESWAIDGLADLDDAEWAIVGVVPAQMLALMRSLAAGLTPDNPFPSGEVNRVVQGVTIHPLLGAER